MLDRYAAKAAEIGAGMSTLRRWVEDFGEHGPAGLADDRRRRRRQPLGGADPRWLDRTRIADLSPGGRQVTGQRLQSGGAGRHAGRSRQ
jgi:hypothetical protein